MVDDDGAGVGGGGRAALAASGNGNTNRGTCDGFRNAVAKAASGGGRGRGRRAGAGLSIPLLTVLTPYKRSHAAHTVQAPRSRPTRRPNMGRGCKGKKKGVHRHGTRRRVDAAAARASDCDRRLTCRAISLQHEPEA